MSERPYKDMSERTYVEFMLEQKKSCAIRNYEKLLKRFVECMDQLATSKLFLEHLNSSNIPAMKLGIYEELMDKFNNLYEKVKLQLENTPVYIGHYEILNDIRRGKVKLVDAKTNKLAKINLSILDV